MPARLTAAERAEWVQNARSLCPYCRYLDGEVEATDYDWDDGCLVKVRCLNHACGRRWVEMYSLTGMLELDADDNIIEDREDQDVTQEGKASEEDPT